MPIATHQVAFSQAIFPELGASASAKATADKRAWGSGISDPSREIDGHDVFAEAYAKLRDRHVLRVGLISIERRTIAKDDDKRRVVRPRRVNDICADGKSDDAIDVVKPLQARSMLRARSLRRVRLVFEADDVSKHALFCHCRPSSLDLCPWRP